MNRVQSLSRATHRKNTSRNASSVSRARQHRCTSRLHTLQRQITRCQRTSLVRGHSRTTLSRWLSLPRRHMSLAMVKRVRAETGAPLMDCKAAVEAVQDVSESEQLAKAVEFLRKKGVLAAAKKSSRQTGEGLIGLARSADNASLGLVEINCETDFVARNETFQEFALDVSRVALSLAEKKAGSSVTELQDDVVKQQKLPGKDITIADGLIEAVNSIRENLNVTRSAVVQTTASDILSSYVHGKVKTAEGAELGQIASVVVLGCDGDAANNVSLVDFGKSLAMHIAAAKPEYLTREQVPEDILNKEKEIITAQAKEQGKPDSVIEKMMGGRLNKFYQDSVLLDQEFMSANTTDGKPPSVAKALQQQAKEVGASITIKDFLRWEVGEGQQQPTANEEEN